jgi:DNA processing protein
MENNNDDLKYWLAISQLPQIGPARLLKLWRYFKNLESAWQASAASLRAAQLDERCIEQFLLGKNKINPDELLAKLGEHNIQVIRIIDPLYPPLLKQIFDPPALLYYIGNLQNEGTYLAIVGTRKISTYGIRLLKDIIPPLVAQDIKTVSGLALGVDALVHSETLQAQGCTLAVLGGGLDAQNLYPSSNRYLANKIVDSGGLLLSEYPPGTLPLKQHFPRRNRIISGLAQGVLIIEGNLSSGSMITAQLALDQNREIMAIPGSVYSANSAGPNNLIKKGATLINNYSDILEALNLQDISTPIKTYQPTNETEKIILNFLNTEAQDIDEIIRKSGKNTATIQGAITILELKRIIRRLDNNTIVRQN